MTGRGGRGARRSPRVPAPFKERRRIHTSVSPIPPSAGPAVDGERPGDRSDAPLHLISATRDGSTVDSAAIECLIGTTHPRDAKIPSTLAPPPARRPGGTYVDHHRRSRPSQQPRRFRRSCTAPVRRKDKTQARGRSLARRSGCVHVGGTSGLTCLHGLRRHHHDRCPAALRSPYVGGWIYVPKNLTIEAGVVVACAGLQAASGSTLTTQGTPQQPVLFTSRREIVGDEGPPAPGDWWNVGAFDSSTVTLEWTTIRYAGGDLGDADLVTINARLSWNGGGAEYSAGAEIETIYGEVTLRSLHVGNNQRDGIDLSGVPQGTPPILGDLTVGDNGGTAIMVWNDPGSFPASLQGSGNGVNAIWIWGNLGGSEPNGRWTWEANPDFPYLLAGKLPHSGRDRYPGNRPGGAGQDQPLRASVRRPWLGPAHPAAPTTPRSGLLQPMMTPTAGK